MLLIERVVRPTMMMMTMINQRLQRAHGVQQPISIEANAYLCRDADAMTAGAISLADSKPAKRAAKGDF